MEKQKQERRITDAEMNLLKTTFAENEPLLKMMRKAMLGLSMTQDEQDVVMYLFRNHSELSALIRKMFIPEITGNDPLGQQIDLWMTIDNKDRTVDELHMHLMARAKVLSMLEDGLKDLTAPHADNRISFAPTGNVYEDIIWYIARNTYVNHVESRLLEIKILAGQKEETVDETKNRLSKDSSK